MKTRGASGSGRDADMNRMKLLIVMVALLLLAVPASASARTANADDPADAQPTVSGKPDNPDIQHVTVTYDGAQSITINVSFYNALNTLDTSYKYDHYIYFTVGMANGYCSS